MFDNDLWRNRIIIGVAFVLKSKNVWLSLIHMLQKKDKLPLIAFTLSRKRCDEYADMLSSLDLTNGREKHNIHSFFRKSVCILKGTDKELPQVVIHASLLFAI